MKNRIIVFSFFLLASCSTMSHRADGWQGKDISDLYSRWGEPASVVEIPNSTSSVYIWRINGCKNNVTVNEDNRITGYAATGKCAQFIGK